MNTKSYTPEKQEQVEELLRKLCNPVQAKKLAKEIRVMFLGKRLIQLYDEMSYTSRSSAWFLRKTQMTQGTLSSGLRRLEAMGLIESYIKARKRYWKKT